MRLYNGCPDKELQAVIDDNQRAERQLKRLGLHSTYFPMEGGYVVFRGHTPVNDQFYPSRRLAANAMLAST